MNKITKLIAAAAEITRKPYLLNLVLNDDGYAFKKVKSQFGFDKGLPVIDITNLFGNDFKAEIYPYAFLEGSCTPMDIALLKYLAKKYDVKNYLEIGTWRGESVANVASVADKCVTINLPDDTMLKMGMDKDYVGIHRFFSASLPNVEHIQADSLTFNFLSLQQNFDMVFIDGDHHPEAVETDSRNIFKFIDPEHTIVVWHDYARNPEMIRWSVLKGILAGTPPMLHKRLFHISNTMCAVYIPEKLMKTPKTQPFKANKKPRVAFRLVMEAKIVGEQR